MKNFKQIKYLLLFFLLPVLFFSCQKNENAEEEPEDLSVTKEYESGPVKLYLKIDKKKISIAESINLELEAIAEKEYEVKLPDFGDNLDQFKIKDFFNPGAKLIDDKHMKILFTYELEPYLSGEYKIPPMKIKFWETEKGNQSAYELETEEINITVTSILPENYEKLELKDISGPVLPPPPNILLPLLITACVLLVGGGIGFYFFWRYRNRIKQETVIKIPAHEIAFQELEKLIADNLIDSGKLKLFYFRINIILRHYIEDRFSLNAPEQTTEEFLEELKIRKDVFTTGQKDLLKDFLNHSDLVKFADLNPTSDDIQKTFDKCKEFILATKLEN